MKRTLTVLTVLALTAAGVHSWSQAGEQPPVESPAARVDALMGQRRFEEAAELAFPRAHSDPVMAFRAAECLFELGRVEQAIQLWSSLRGDGPLANSAYTRLVGALVAAGRERDALAMAREGLSRLAAPPAELARWDSKLEPTARDRAAVLETLARLEPASAEQARGLGRMYAQAGDAIVCEETLAGPLPTILRLGEHKSHQDLFGVVTPGPRSPKGPAPSAINYGHGEYNPMPPQLGTFAGASVPDTDVEVLRVTFSARLGSAGVVTMALDSSADAVRVPSGVVKTLGLSPVKGPGWWSPGAGVTGGASWVLLPEVRVGPVTFSQVPAIVEEGPDPMAVCPLWLLRHYGLALDRRAGTLTLHPPRTAASEALGPGCVTSPCPWLERRPSLAVRAGQGSPYYILLDTDAACSYVDEGRLGEVGARTDVAKFSHGVAVESFGTLSMNPADNVTLSWGGLSLAMPGVRTVHFGPGLPSDMLGLLGRDVLDRFQLYLDYGSCVAGFRAYRSAK